MKQILKAFKGILGTLGFQWGLQLWRPNYNSAINREGNLCRAKFFILRGSLFGIRTSVYGPFKG